MVDTSSLDLEVVRSDSGAPQHGVLSPLLSNIAGEVLPTRIRLYPLENSVCRDETAVEWVLCGVAGQR